jgi:hypothetical protein
LRSIVMALGGLWRRGTLRSAPNHSASEPTIASLRRAGRHGLGGPTQIDPDVFDPLPAAPYTPAHMASVQ